MTPQAVDLVGCSASNIADAANRARLHGWWSRWGSGGSCSVRGQRVESCRLPLLRLAWSV